LRPPKAHWLRRSGCALLAAILLLGSAAAAAQTPKLAPGFQSLPRAARVALMPIDVELFSISAGGVLEPRADWTQAAGKHLQSALLAKEKGLGFAAVELSERDADEVAEINALHAAVARAISEHHFGPSALRLPTKAGQLDWSLGEAVRAIRQKTGADYALFAWIRDSYASGERVAAMIALAIFGIGIPGGVQIGYASLVDLENGRVLWFNRLQRPSGDLREAEKAVETLEALLSGFPQAR
jgi:hypothetical protein